MLSDYRVTALIYPNGEYRLGKAVPVIDEGSFYRIDETHIFDKYKILEIVEDGNQVTVKMKDREVTLITENSI